MSITPLRNPFVGHLGLGDLFARDTLIQLPRGSLLGADPPLLTDDVGQSPWDMPQGELRLLAQNTAPPDGVAPQGRQIPWYNQDSQLNKYEGDANSRHVTQIPTEEQQPKPKNPIGITTRNNEVRSPDTDRAIDARLADALEAASEDIVGFNINSSTGGKHGNGTPSSTSAHYFGRAVDINGVGGLPVTDPSAAPAMGALVQHFKGNPNVDRIYGPHYNGRRERNGSWRELNPRYPADRDIIDGHRTHMHIGVSPRD